MFNDDQSALPWSKDVGNQQPLGPTESPVTTSRGPNPDGTILTAVYNRNGLFRQRYIPREWKENLIVLVHKKANREDLKIHCDG